LEPGGTAFPVFFVSGARQPVYVEVGELPVGELLAAYFDAVEPEAEAQRDPVAPQVACGAFDFDILHAHLPEGRAATLGYVAFGLAPATRSVFGVRRFISAFKSHASLIFDFASKQEQAWFPEVLLY